MFQPDQAMVEGGDTPCRPAKMRLHHALGHQQQPHEFQTPQVRAAAQEGGVQGGGQLGFPGLHFKQQCEAEQQRRPPERQQQGGCQCQQGISKAVGAHIADLPSVIHHNSLQARPHTPQQQRQHYPDQQQGPAAYLPRNLAQYGLPALGRKHTVKLGAQYPLAKQ